MCIFLVLLYLNILIKKNKIMNWLLAVNILINIVGVAILFNGFLNNDENWQFSGVIILIIVSLFGYSLLS